MIARYRWAALLLGCCAGCNTRSAEEGATQQQIARLCWVEDRMRRAPNPEKESFLADLARAPCPAPDACRMRDDCVSAYTVHVDALKLTAAAKQLIADRRDGEAARILGAAQAKLGEAGPKIEQCTAAAADLRRAYSIR